MQDLEDVAKNNKNFKIVYWSPLDGLGDKPLSVRHTLSQENIVADDYHLNTRGTEDITRQYFINNCDIDGWENTCKLPQSWYFGFSGEPVASVYTLWTIPEAEAHLATGWGSGAITDLALEYLYRPDTDEVSGE